MPAHIIIGRSPLRGAVREGLAIGPEHAIDLDGLLLRATESPILEHESPSPPKDETSAGDRLK
jgi:hypothetical protein